MKKWQMGIIMTAACLAINRQVMAQDCCPCINNSYNGNLFSGFYVGGNIGFVDFTAERSEDQYFLVDGTSHGEDVNFTAGIQAGYDWLYCNQLLLGLVADWNWANNEFRSHYFKNNEVGFRGSYLDVELNWFSTIRARAGYACNDAVLFYITGGAAVSEIKTTSNLINAETDSFDHIKNSKTRWGWTAGFGAEFAVWCNWSLGAELLYMRFAQKTVHFTPTQITEDGPVGPTSVRWTDQAWVGRISLNYRFCL